MIDSVGYTRMGSDEYIRLKATYGTRIYAGEDYDTYDSNFSVADYYYVFCSDGIYFNGYKLISTPS